MGFLIISLKKRMTLYRLLIVFSLFSSSLYGQIPSISQQLWTQITTVSDEFNSFDGTKWSTNGDCLGGFHPDCYLNPTSNGSLSNISYGVPTGSSSGSALKLKIKKEPTTIYENCPYYDNANKIPVNYSGGQIVSKIKLQYGYYEIKAKLPAISGINVGGNFWLWNQTCPSDYNPGNRYFEIDVFEMCSIEPTVYPLNAHTWICNKCEYQHNLSTDLHNMTFPGIDFTSQYHIMGLDWQPDHIDYYIDNVLVKHVVDNQLISSTCVDDSLPQPSISTMSIPMWLVLDGVISNNLAYNSYPLPNTTGVDYEIDYFRYYKKNPDLSLSSINLSLNTLSFLANTNLSGDTYQWIVGGSTVSSANTYNMNVSNNTNYSLDNVKASQVILQSTFTYIPSFTAQSSIDAYIGYGGLGINKTTTLPSQGNVIFISDTISSGTIFGSNKNVIFKAKSGIDLTAGFEIDLGSTFIAESDITQ